MALVLLLHWWPSTFPGGDSGVDLFFVLSGFLITRLIVEEVWTSGAFDVRAFYARRFRRLMPASTLLVLSCIGSAGAGWVLLYSANWARIDGVLDGGPLEHTWSLAIEEQFYIVWPTVLVAVVLRCRWPAIPILCSVAIVVFHRLSLADGGWMRVTAGTDTRLDAMLVGAAVAVSITVLLRQRIWPAMAAVITPVLLVIVLLAPDLTGLGFTAVAFAWAIVVVWAVESNGWISVRPLRWCGRLSYSLYLWHYPVTWLLRDGDLRNTTLTTTAIAIPTSFAAAILSNKFVEDRFRRARPLDDGADQDRANSNKSIKSAHAIRSRRSMSSTVAVAAQSMNARARRRRSNASPAASPRSASTGR